MKTGLTAKFSQNPKLGNILRNTGNKLLAEANPTDNFWGVAMSLEN